MTVADDNRGIITPLIDTSPGWLHVREICGGNSRIASCVGRSTGRGDMLGLLIGAVALGGGFVGARNFVRRRLRFVAAVQRPAAPLVAGLPAAGLGAAGGALPLVAIR